MGEFWALRELVEHKRLMNALKVLDLTNSKAIKKTVKVIESGKNINACIKVSVIWMESQLQI